MAAVTIHTKGKDCISKGLFSQTCSSCDINPQLGFKNTMEVPNSRFILVRNCHQHLTTACSPQLRLESRKNDWSQTS